jgi:type II secretory pathway pseudopilin PulG
MNAPHAIKSKDGFTIIEVMLFLAISGLMMFGLFAAANSSISNQRYTTAVKSFRDFLQGEYNSVANVQNTDVDPRCGNSPRGASDCSMIGRIVRSSDDGKSFVSRVVYSELDVAGIPADERDSDAEALKWLRLDELDSSDVDVRDYTLEWDTVATKKDGSSDVAKLSIFIYRSPITGQINSIVDDMSNTRSLTDLVNGMGSSSSDVRVCVDSNGLTSISRMGLDIKPRVSSSSAISDVNGDC